MVEQTDLYSIVAGYTYLGIAFYYIIFDFVSPVSDELSLIIIAWLANKGMMNVWGGGVVAFLALYSRNIILFYLSRNRTRLIGWLTDRYPVWMGNYQHQMSKKLMHTVFILMFIPKLRILIPLAAGFGQVKVHRFLLAQGMAMALFIAIYYPLGIFFYTGIQSLIERMGKADQYVFIVSLFVLAILISFFVGRYILRKAGKQ